MSALADSARSPARFGLKQIVVAVLLVGLGAVAALAFVRETRAPAAAPETAAAATSSAFHGEPARPPLSAAEEAYAQALWDVHTRVRTDAVRMPFTGIKYKSGEIDRNEVKKQIAPLTASFTDSLRKVEAIKVPASQQKSHDLYVQALELMRDASVEMVKVAADGKDEHLLKSHELSEKAASNLMEVSAALWPGEYKPN